MAPSWRRRPSLWAIDPSLDALVILLRPLRSPPGRGAVATGWVGMAACTAALARADPPPLIQDTVQLVIQVKRQGAGQLGCSADADDPP